MTKFDLYMYDEHHEKRDLKVFVLVIPKEGWHPSFGMTPTLTEFDSADIIDYILEKSVSFTLYLSVSP